eukprot:scaffold124015_cov63-Phaeocystis_antarctica.AAC.1
MAELLPDSNSRGSTDASSFNAIEAGPHPDALRVLCGASTERARPSDEAHDRSGQVKLSARAGVPKGHRRRDRRRAHNDQLLKGGHGSGENPRRQEEQPGEVGAAELVGVH